MYIFLVGGYISFKTFNVLSQSLPLWRVSTETSECWSDWFSPSVTCWFLLPESVSLSFPFDNLIKTCLGEAPFPLSLLLSLRFFCLDAYVSSKTWNNFNYYLFTRFFSHSSGVPVLWISHSLVLCHILCILSFFTFNSFCFTFVWLDCSQSLGSPGQKLFSSTWSILLLNLSNNILSGKFLFCSS